LKLDSFKNKQTEIVGIPLPILAHPLKKILEKSRFFNKKGKKPISINKVSQKLLYTQVAGLSVSDILKLKDNYPNLPAKKIENIQKIIDDSGKTKP